MYILHIIVYIDIMIYLQNKKLENARDKIEHSKREAISINEKKLKIQLGIGNLKIKMIKEIEDFSLGENES
jgi:methyl coenzyme M reductase subunit D